MKRIYALAICGLLVSGCHELSGRFERMSGKQPPKNAIHEPVYCYKSIGEVNCYNTPQLGQESRLVGHFQPPVSAHAPAAPAEIQYTPAPEPEIKVNDVTATKPAKNSAKATPLLKKKSSKKK